MATGRVSHFAPWLLLALASTGCSQPGVFSSRQTMVGSLKASVSQLEFENEKLKKEVGELKSENSRLGAEYSEEKALNGEITARLDDAKELLRRQGGSAQAMGLGSSTSFEDDEIPPPVQPKSRSIKRGRSSPSVQIPGPAESAPLGASASDGLGYRTTPRASRDLGSDDQESSETWLPIARGLGTQVRQ